MVLSPGAERIADREFHSARWLETIVLPSDIKSIGDHAFAYCDALTAVKLQQPAPGQMADGLDACLNIARTGIQSIGHSAFNECHLLTSINLESLTSCTSLGSHAFFNCGSLRTITIPDKVKEIGSSTFYACGALVSVTLPAGLESIGEAAFYRCVSLKTIVIPESVTYISEDAFLDCASLDRPSRESIQRICPGEPPAPDPAWGNREWMREVERLTAGMCGTFKEQNDVEAAEAEEAAKKKAAEAEEKAAAAAAREEAAAAKKAAEAKAAAEQAKAEAAAAKEIE